VSSQTPWSFNASQVFIAIVYWDGTNGSVGEERHGLTMDWATHKYNHESKGTVYISGYLPSVTIDNGSDNSHAEMQSISSGTIYDEDIENTNDDEQTSYEIWYKTGSGVNIVWQHFDASPSLVAKATNRPYYNQDNGGTWQLTEVGNTNFTLTHIFATNKIEYTGAGDKITDNRIILIMGENEYNSAIDAEEGALTEIYNLTSAFVPIATVIIECRDNFQNTYNARVLDVPSDGAEFVDFRTGGRSGVGGSGSHHGNLSGLFDDDHLQYLLLDGRGGQSITDEIILNGSLTINDTNPSSDDLLIVNGDITCNTLNYTTLNPAIDLSGYVNKDGTTNLTGDWTISSNNITLTEGTVQAEQITSTDDITMQGHLLTLGDGTDTNIDIYFNGSTNDAIWRFSPSSNTTSILSPTTIATGPISTTTNAFVINSLISPSTSGQTFKQLSFSGGLNGSVGDSNITEVSYVDSDCSIVTGGGPAYDGVISTFNNYNARCTTSGGSGDRITDYCAYRVEEVPALSTNTFGYCNNTTADNLMGYNNSNTFFGTNKDVGFSFDGTNLLLDLAANGTNGFKIGLTTSEKIAFYGSTPIVQQTTTSQTAASFTANTSGISDDTATWNGYTIGDLVAILQAYGLLT
jgi:hypothetical protein